MEGDTQGILSLFGLSLEKLTFATGFIYLAVEAVKRKLPSIFIGGWRTDLLAFVSSFLVAFKMYGQQWESVIALTIIAWLAPAGIHAAMKNGKK